MVQKVITTPEKRGIVVCPCLLWTVVWSLAYVSLIIKKSHISTTVTSHPHLMVVHDSSEILKRSQLRGPST